MNATGSTAFSMGPGAGTLMVGDVLVLCPRPKWYVRGWRWLRGREPEPRYTIVQVTTDTLTFDLAIGRELPTEAMVWSRYEGPVH